MALKLGKRKRREELIDEDVTPGQLLDKNTASEMHNVLRRHFEAAFEPLADHYTLPAAATSIDANSSEVESGSDWDGISEGQSDSAEVIDHAKSSLSKAEVSIEELKTFMSTKPPSGGVEPVSTGIRKQVDSIDSEKASTDAANLKKDLALQRLLKESHLLDSQNSLSHSGQNRHKALDLRLQDLGSRKSIFEQQNMPLAQRRGIKAKAAEKEENRRRIAQQNGIILERDVKGKRKDHSKRQRGIGAPSVGKFQGGMLKLSKKDIAEIEGPRKTSRGRKYRLDAIAAALDRPWSKLGGTKTDQIAILRNKKRSGVLVALNSTQAKLIIRVRMSIQQV